MKIPDANRWVAARWDAARESQIRALNAEIGRLKADAEWGRVLWDWLRGMLPDAGCCLEFDTEDLMKLAEKHGRARKVKYDPAIHGEINDAEPGSEIWWWGDPVGTPPA